MAKILVCDDEPDMVWALTNVLLSENHSVIAVNSGQEALDKLKETSVDLALLDFRLPDMDGIQVLEKIKQMRPELPVIMVTGYGGIEEAVQSIKLGAAHYIPKPFDNNQLVEIVNKSLHLNQLKKEKLFGKRLAEKIDPGLAAPAPRSVNPPMRQSSGYKRAGLFAAAGLAAALAVFGAWNFFSDSAGGHEYPVAESRISGLSWGNGYLWVSDWFSQTIQQYQIQGKNMILVKTTPLPGFHLTGIAWAETAVYTCDSWKKMIYKHRMDGSFSVISGAPSPGPNPSGLFFDGKYLWSCDGNTQKVYQHNLDETLTVLATYDTPAVFPVGLYHDKKDFWVAGAVGKKIFRHAMNERFQPKDSYTLLNSPENAQQISAFTLLDGKVWLTYEGVSKIFELSLRSLEKAK